MDEKRLLQLRKQRGYVIAQTKKIENKDGVWLVPSATIPNKVYRVALTIEGTKCNCEDFKERGVRCKHGWAVDFIITRTIHKGGSTTTITTKRVQYPQNWSTYNLSQTTEKDMFLRLMADLCKDIDEPLYRFGRPKLSMADMVFSSALKVYTTFSLRRFITDMKDAFGKGYVTHVCSYSSVSNYMRNENLTKTLQQLVTLSSMPLRSIETKFAIDSTGFRTTKFNDYCREKHNTRQEHKWVKAHLCTGVKTNVITAVEVGFEEQSADSPQFIPLSERTRDAGFTIEEMSADKAYSGRTNYDCINNMGGVAYIPFRSNATGKSRGSRAWMRMYRFFTYNRDEFMVHYHLRSNIESTNNMIKAKFIDLVRSKDKTAQINEVLLKVLCHNVVVLIQSMNEFGAEPDFIKA